MYYVTLGKLGRQLLSEFRYKAFISYSHQNSQIAARLLKKLEGYRVPAHLNASRRRFEKAPNTLGRMFRDREELSASVSLDSKLLDAIKQSEFLIVVCSPDAAGSRRVNEEITQFIKHRDSRNVLCYIVEGEPEFGPITGQLTQDCVSPVLRKQYIQSGQIPVAADAREIGDGPSRALQKIIAGLLEVGLDELVQRDARRHQNRLVMVAAISVGFALLTTGLLVRANLAEGAAQQATLDAQLQNERAEDLIHFMVEDLVGIKLVQLGRLDVIDAVIVKVATHYSQQDDDKLGPLGLARTAQAYQKLGQLYLNGNMHESADELFEYANRTTAALTERFPDSEEAVFAHVRGLYWVGLSNIFRGRYTAAENIWRERVDYGEVLLREPEHSPKVWAGLGDIYVHLGWSLMELGRVEEAYVEFKKGLDLRQANADRYPEDISWLNSLAGGFYHMQWAELYLGMNEQALKNALISNKTYKKLTLADPLDQRARGNYARSLRWLAEAEIANAQFGEAATHLRESIIVHKKLLDFEPNELTFRYQACVSSVMLVEVLIADGKPEEAKKANNSVCGDSTAVLALDHPVAHNRFYGYRRELTRIKLEMLDGHNERAAQKLTIATSRFERESTEIKNSLLGRRIALSLAIDAVELGSQMANLPNAKRGLWGIVAKISSGFGTLHSPTARLLSRAKQLSTETSGEIETDSLSINF